MALAHPHLAGSSLTAHQWAVTKTAALPSLVLTECSSELKVQGERLTFDTTREGPGLVWLILPQHRCAPGRDVLGQVCRDGGTGWTLGL